MQEIDLREGTIILRVRDLMRARATLFATRTREGRLKLVKRGRKLEFLHEINKVPTRVEVDLSEIHPEEIEEIAITWSVFTRKFCLYLNGEKYAETELNYGETLSYIA